MKKGLYKVSFKTPMGQGTGVVVIADGTIKGGDRAMYYIGAFQEVDNQVTATLRIGKHTDVPGSASVFGLNDVNLKLQGTSTVNSAFLQGSAAEAPSVLFSAQLDLIAE